MVSVILMIILGSITGILMFTFSDYIGILFGFSVENINIASTYIKIVGTALLVESFIYSYGGILNLKGKTKVVMVVAIIQSVINIGLNYVFLTGTFGVPQIGIYGICIATVISQVLAAISLLFYVQMKENIVFRVKALKGKGIPIVKQILNIGVPASLEPVSVQVIGIVINILVITLGMTAMATKKYTFNVLSLISAWSGAIGVGTLIIIARSVGAKKYDKADTQLRSSILLSTVVSISTVLLITIFSRQIFGIFTTDPEILQLARTLLIISIFCEPIKGINIIVVNSLCSAGDSKFPSIIGTIIMWSIEVPICYILGFTLEFGLVGIWLLSFFGL